MKTEQLRKGLADGSISIPLIKDGQKIKGTVIKKIENGVLVNCENGMFTGVILSKEVKELEKNGVDLSP
jgi:ribosomal protein S1